MSQEELFGVRDLTYSAWHRRLSTRRFVGIEYAQLLTMIDLDCSLYVEYDDGTKEPLALIETAQDRGQKFKSSTVTRKLAERASLPAYTVLYRLSKNTNPANRTCQDIEGFRVKRLFPKPDNDWRAYTPDEYATLLLRLRKWVCGHLDKKAPAENAG